MRAGYVALFSLIVGFSAYQGSTTQRSNHPQHEGQVDHGLDAQINSTKSFVFPPGAEPFPEIARGIFKLELTEETVEPCPSPVAICPARELEDLIGDYFQPQIPQPETPNRKKHSAIWGVPSEQEGGIKFIIATLPDPVHTHMALWFDRWVDAIEKAAQAEGYFFSRAWMPWDVSTHHESTDFTVRMAQAKLQDSKELLPGLMIFRNTDKETGLPSTLFVFVVGETPTGGLHAEQFQNALYIRQSILTHSPGAHVPTDLRIFGPTFSGSLQSLAAALNAMPHQWFPRILIRSGSVSSYRAAHDFCEATQSLWSGDATNRPEFTTFQFSDQYEEFFLSSFFVSRHETHSHVAVLSEDETEFGNQERMPSTAPPEGQTEGNQCPTEPTAPLIPLTRLYFPRDIAELRGAYQQNIKVQLEDGVANNAAPQRLPLTLGITGNDDDSVAPYASLQTPLSQESIMQAIVSTLRQRHAKVVIIRAANPLDMVFLARYLRQNYPQARLVTSAADLLMVYDVTDPRFHGILAVTSYPLLNGASFPTQRRDTATTTGTTSNLCGAQSSNNCVQEVQRVFPDGFSIGAFNAFLSLLGPQPTRKPYPTQQLLPSRPYAQFGLPSFLEKQIPDENQIRWRPHLWLTTVGRDGYWPVADLDAVRQNEIEDKEDKVLDKTKPRRPDPTIPAVDAITNPPMQYTVHFSVGWTISWAIAFVLSLLVSFLFVYVQPSSGSEIVARFSRTPSRARNRLLFMASMLLLLLQTFFVFPAIVWLKSFGSIDKDATGWWARSSEYIDGLWLVWICYLMSVAILAFACRKRFTKDLRCENFSRAGFFTCLIFGIATVALTWAVPWQRLDGAFQNFIYRYIHVESGVSPMLPLLFGVSAWLWWCWQSLTGVASTEEKYMALPVPSDFDIGPGPTFERVMIDAYDRVRLKELAMKDGDWPWNTLSPVPFHRKITISAVVGLIVILLLMRPSEIAEAFEPLVYKVMYWIVLYSCLFLICYLVTQIVVLWLELRNLLRAIERLPFSRGFGDLKNLTWKPLWKLAGSGRQEFTRVFSQEVAVLTQIKNSKLQQGPLANAIEQALSTTEAVSAEWEWKPVNNPQVSRLFGDVQQKMAQVASQALIFVSEKWKHEGYSPPGKSAATKDPENPRIAEEPAKDPLLRAVEYFLCLFYLNVVLVPLRRLQTLILAMAGVFVFALISYSSYPFESRESFHALLISILFAISLAVGIVYGQMYANPLLSRITNTKPGELGLDFWVRLGTFVFVPLLSVLSVQFPEINSFLFSWLQPALQSVK